jgi:hypothetical protein
MAEWTHCVEMRDLIPEVAMGVAPGDQRARALAHVAVCAECRALLARATDAVDELMLLAPEAEPPIGFDARVLEALQPRQGRRRIRIAVAAAAALVLMAAGGVLVTRWVDRGDRELASQYRSTLGVAHGSYLRAAPLTSTAGHEAGVVFAYQGRPSWVFMTVSGAEAGDYRVVAWTRDGRAHRIGTCWVGDARSSWGAEVDVPISAVDRIEMRGHGTTYTADFYRS